MLSRSDDEQTQIQDANLQLLVLLNLTSERIEFLEEKKYIFGTIKNHLKKAKTAFEDFIYKVFKVESNIEGESAKTASAKLLVMQERVEKALVNEYVITTEERMLRAKKILSEKVNATYEVGDTLKKLELKKELLIDEILEEMYEKNLFNF